MKTDGLSAPELLLAARAQMFSGWTDVGSQMARLGSLAADRARAAGDRQTQAQAQFFAQHHAILALPFDAALARLAQAQQHCAELGVDDAHWQLEITRANLLYLHRRYLEAIQIAAAIDRRHASRLAPVERVAVVYLLASCCALTGRCDEVIEYADRAVRLADESQHLNARVAARLNFAGHLFGLALDPKAALPLVQQAQDLLGEAPASAAWHQCLAMKIRALDLLGRHEEAYALFKSDVDQPASAAFNRAVSSVTALALIGVGRLDEAEAWLGEPPRIGDSDHHWRRHLAYSTARMRLLCARGRYAEARAHAQAEFDQQRPYVLEPLMEVLMYDGLREACAGLGDTPGAVAAALAARQVCLPLIRISSRARYLVTQLSQGDISAQALSAIDLRRLAAIDHAVDSQPVEPISAAEPAPAAPPAPATASASASASASTPPAPQMPKFLAHVAHELRTPIGGVMGMASLLMMSKLDDKQRSYAKVLHGSAQTLLLLVNDVLDLAKIERGLFTLNAEPTALQPWLDETLAPFVELARFKGVLLTGRCAPELPGELAFDGLRLRQVLSNLISNAVKFTRRGAITVDLRLQPAVGVAASALRFEVRDTGCGIAPHELGRLFQEFVQANEKVAGQYGGTGLGLALCKQLVERMGGRIGVASVLGEGSVFWFELDLAVVPVEA